MSKPQSFIVTPEDHKPFHVVGEAITVLANVERTGSIEVFLQDGPEGAGPPPHVHPWDEAYYVLEGAIDVVTGDRTQTIGQGEFMFIPGGTPHTFRMKTARARFLSFTSSGNASKFFRDVDHEVGDTLDVSKMIHIANRQSVEVVAPPSGS